MGFFDKMKSAYASGVVETEVQDHYIALQKANQAAEAFERLVTIWSHQMTKRGKPILALSGEFTVHFWVVATNNAKDACKYLAYQICAYTMDGFKDTVQFREMEATLFPIMEAYQNGQNDALNQAFQRRSPICYQRFLETHGRGPFSPVKERNLA